MDAKDKKMALRYAERWAFEVHQNLLFGMPRELRHAINWEAVARSIGIEWPEMNAPTPQQDMQRIVDYLYDDEAEDYTYLEKHFQEGHIFESITAVQRWLRTLRQ